MISICILTAISILLGFLLLKQLKLEKNFIICLFITGFTLLFFSNIEVALEGAKKGLILCFNSIIPSLFAFSVICNLLISFNGIHIYSKILGKIICKPFRLSINCSFALIASFLCGYPLGAKYAGESLNRGLISPIEYKRLINIASTASPIFMLGILGVSFLGDITFGYIILFSNFLGTLLLSLLLKPSKEIKCSLKSFESHKNTTSSLALQSSIESGLLTTLTVCGYVVAFSLIISLLKDISFIQNFFYSIEKFLTIPKDSLYGLFLGSIEITNGSSLIASTTLPLTFKISILSFFCSFSGVSIIFQTTSFFKASKISILKYSILKFVQGVLSFIIAFISSSLFLTNIETSSLSLCNKIGIFPILLTLSLLLAPFIFFIFKKKVR